MIDPKTATTTAAMKPCTWLNPIAVASQPPMQATDDPDDDIGQAAAPGPATDQGARDRPGEEADDDPADEVHLKHGESLA